MKPTGIVSVSYWEWFKLLALSLLISLAITATSAAAIWCLAK
jgi:hypothetical protein